MCHHNNSILNTANHTDYRNTSINTYTTFGQHYMSLDHHTPSVCYNLLTIVRHYRHDRKHFRRTQIQTHLDTDFQNQRMDRPIPIRILYKLIHFYAPLVHHIETLVYTFRFGRFRTVRQSYKPFRHPPSLSHHIRFASSSLDNFPGHQLQDKHRCNCHTPSDWCNHHLLCIQPEHMSRFDKSHPSRIDCHPYKYMCR